MAFRLVETESSFRQNAVSEAGAIGYTQILPSTAQWLDPRVDEADLYERDVNLRFGFRYLRLLLEENAGDMRLALLAYNRGPGTVRAIVANGGDPANGYATRVMGSE
jgi:soluble lytic murein transglycosylase-like protein